MCGSCLTEPPLYHKARSVGVYDQSLRTAIHTLKYSGRVHLADPLGRLLFDCFQRHWPDDGMDLIAPVPLHRRRFRRRGFNQAYLLIRKWGRRTPVPIVRDLLVRTRPTANQTGLDKRQRRANTSRAFAMRRPGQSNGHRVLLVDDVLTTGATADACARVLLRDGARRVDLLTLARVM